MTGQFIRIVDLCDLHGLSFNKVRSSATLSAMVVDPLPYFPLVRAGKQRVERATGEGDRMVEKLRIRRRNGSGNLRNAASVTVRLTAAEADTIDAARAEAGKLRRAEYLRVAALTIAAGGPGTVGPAPELLDLRRELGRIGGNLAQLLKASNYGNLPEAVEIREVLAELGQVAADLRAAL